MAIESRIKTGYIVLVDFGYIGLVVHGYIGLVDHARLHYPS